LAPDPPGSTLPVGMASRRNERCNAFARDPLCHGGSASGPAAQATRESVFPTWSWVTRSSRAEDLVRRLGDEAGGGHGASDVAGPGRPRACGRLVGPAGGASARSCVHPSRSLRGRKIGLSGVVNGLLAGSHKRPNYFGGLPAMRV
jgi:hypothetical protein